MTKEIMINAMHNEPIQRIGYFPSSSRNNGSWCFRSWGNRAKMSESGSFVLTFKALLILSAIVTVNSLGRVLAFSSSFGCGFTSAVYFR
jgi:hypothetical protein